MKDLPTMVLMKLFSRVLQQSVVVALIVGGLGCTKPFDVNRSATEASGSTSLGSAGDQNSGTGSQPPVGTPAGTTTTPTPTPTPPPPGTTVTPPPTTPTPTPDPYANAPAAESTFFRLMWRDDPATTMEIGFAARSATLEEHKVHYDVVDHGRNVDAYAQVKTVDVIRPYLNMNNAFARLTNLKPETVYYFVVRDSKGVSKRYSFMTAPATAATRLSIVAGGDSRNNSPVRRNANLLVKKIRPHVVMFGGDMTDTGSESQWREWLNDWQLTIGDDGRMTPVLVTRGNHESSNTILQNFFDTPTNVYYALTLGGNLLRVYTLNTEISIGGDQTSWLTGDLTSNRAVTWKIAQYHKPMRPHLASKAEGNSQYTYWADLFYKEHMNVIVESDSHVVKTTWPIRPSTSGSSDEGFVRDDAEGSLYLGEGCWGAPLRAADSPKTWTRDSGSFNHFNWIFVDANKIEVRTVKVDNASKVGVLSDSNRFSLPANIDIWKPANGDLITVQKK